MRNRIEPKVKAVELRGKQKSAEPKPILPAAIPNTFWLEKNRSVRQISYMSDNIKLDQLLIRKLEPGDPLQELTLLLNRAYKQLADMGLRYLATYQDARTTAQRITGGTCLVALLNNKLVGTILYHSPARTDGAPWFDRKNVAKISQMGVEPGLQKNGIGLKLMQAAEQLARLDKAEELALDTAESAYHLISWYERLGYRFIEYCQWDVTNYRSVIMSKSLQESPD